MKPVYLNPSPSSFPLVELKEEPHLQLSLSPVQQPASSLSADDHPTFFNTTFTTQDQRVGSKPEESKPYDHKEASSSSSLQSAVDINSTANDHNLSFSRKVDAYETASDAKGSSLKWMLSKMRLMKKMKNSNCSTRAADNEPAVNHKFQCVMHDSNETGSLCKTSNDSIRVCSDCHTSTTPLWRSGPRGPKSLCNACGIRKRKARRAIEAEANGAADATSMKIKVQKNKDKKKQRTSPINVQYKKHDHHLKVTSDYNNSPAGRRRHHQIQTQKKLCVKEIGLSLSKNSALQHVFPQDMEDAAILLLAISCGLVHS